MTPSVIFILFSAHGQTALYAFHGLPNVEPQLILAVCKVLDAISKQHICSCFQAQTIFSEQHQKHAVFFNVSERIC